MTRIGFYPGSFDPVTLGHTDVVARACRLVDRLIIGVGVHDAKAPLFTADERIAMFEAEAAPLAAASGTKIEFVTFSGLAVAAARELGAGIIIRGLRDATDFDYEVRMGGMNNAMAPDIETVFVVAGPGVQHIAANLVRQIAVMGGDVSPFVSPRVAARLKTKSRA